MFSTCSKFSSQTLSAYKLAGWSYQISCPLTRLTCSVSFSFASLPTLSCSHRSLKNRTRSWMKKKSCRSIWWMQPRLWCKYLLLIWTKNRELRSFRAWISTCQPPWLMNKAQKPKLSCDRCHHCATSVRLRICLRALKMSLSYSAE